MALQVKDILLDGVTADPISLADGTMWYRSDIKEWRFRKNGQTKKLASKGTNTTEEDVAQCKCDATVAPVATNDSSEGYTVSSLWIDITADKAYICIDNTATAAIWTEITQGGGTGDLLAANNLSDVSSAATARTNLNVDVAGTDNAPNATTTVKGKVEKSTSAENIAGTSDLVYPTVAGTKEMIDTHGGGGGGSVLSNLNVGDKSGAGITTQSATYIVLGYLSAFNATIASAKVVVRQNSGGTGQVRIWNATQGNVVMESATFSSLSLVTIDISTVTNQPAANDVLEVELKRVTGSGGNNSEFFSAAILYTV